jgi:hypothetical protein
MPFLSISLFTPPFSSLRDGHYFRFQFRHFAFDLHDSLAFFVSFAIIFFRFRRRQPIFTPLMIRRRRCFRLAARPLPFSARKAFHAMPYYFICAAAPLFYAIQLRR